MSKPTRGTTLEPARHSDRFIDELIAGAGSQLEMAHDKLPDKPTQEWSALDSDDKERLLDAHFAPSSNADLESGGEQKLGRVTRMRLRQSRRKVCIVVAILIGCWVLGGLWTGYARSWRDIAHRRPHTTTAGAAAGHGTSEAGAAFVMDETMTGGTADKTGGRMEQVKATLDKVSSAASAAAEKGKSAATIAAERGKNAVSAAVDRIDKSTGDKSAAAAAAVVKQGKAAAAEKASSSSSSSGAKTGGVDNIGEHKAHTPGQPQTPGQINARPPATNIMDDSLSEDRPIDPKKPATAASGGNGKADVKSHASTAEKAGVKQAESKTPPPPPGKQVKSKPKSKAEQAQDLLEDVVLAEHAESSRDAADANLLNAARAGG